MKLDPPSPSPWVTSMTGTPAASSAATIDRTSSAVNWWRLWCEPSRSDVSVIRMSQMGLKKMSVLMPDAPVAALTAMPQSLLGDLLADLGGRRGHDVEVARIRRQVVARALDLDERGDHARGRRSAPTARRTAAR